MIPAEPTKKKIFPLGGRSYHSVDHGRVHGEPWRRTSHSM